MTATLSTIYIISALLVFVGLLDTGGYMLGLWRGLFVMLCPLINTLVACALVWQMFRQWRRGR